MSLPRLLCLLVCTALLADALSEREENTSSAGAQRALKMFSDKLKPGQKQAKPRAIRPKPDERALLERLLAYQRAREGAFGRKYNCFIKPVDCRLAAPPAQDADITVGNRVRGVPVGGQN